MFRKKTVLRIIFVYILLTAGIYMFLESCSNSYNRISKEKIVPASIVINDNKASVSILESKFNFSIKMFLPKSKIYYVAYTIASDDIRLMSYCISLMYDKL